MMHYGIIKGDIDKDKFWVTDEKWELIFKCKAYDKVDYYKRVLKFKDKLNVSMDEFRENMSLSDSIEEAKYYYNVDIFLKNKTHPDYTDNEWEIAKSESRKRREK